MALHFLSNTEFALSESRETEIYEETKFEEGGSTSLPGLALYALKHGIGVKYYTNHEIPKRPRDTSPSEYDRNMAVYKRHLESARDRGLIEQIGYFTVTDLVWKEIYSEHPVLCLIKLGSEEALHNVLLRGHKGCTVHFVDPAAGIYRTRIMQSFEQDMDLSFFKAALSFWTERE